MKHISWITAGIGTVIGFILANNEQEGGAFIAGICAAGGYLLGELIKFLLKRSADARARRQGSHYTPEQWEEYRKHLKG